MIMFLQIVTFAGIYFKLGDLMSLFSLQSNDSQNMGRQVFRRPRQMMNRQTRRFQRSMSKIFRGKAGSTKQKTMTTKQNQTNKANHTRQNERTTPKKETALSNVKKQKSKIEFWTKEEFEKVISLIYKEDYYQHFLFISLWFLFMTGMRIGEATAIQWEDIDFDSGVLTINKTLYYKNQSNYRFVEPKTKASVRHIVLDKCTLTYLSEWKEVQQNLIQTDFVMSYNGIPTQKHTLSYAIERYAKLAGIHRIRIHGLRHSHASLLISMGENPLIIKDRLGHEDIETTLGTYGHLYPNSNFEVANKLNGAISFKEAKQNYDTSPKNQFTVDYLRNKEMKKVQ